MFNQLHAAARQVSQVVVGKDQQVRLAITCLLAGGHLLLEDLPGVGKTTLAHALAISLGLKFNRVQFTSDLLPADVALWFVLVGVADRCAGRWALAAAAVCEAAALATLIGERTGMPGHPAVPLTAITVAAALFGRNRRNHRAYLTSLRDRAERAERELDQQARVAVAEERTRIAREVHDVVSHNLSVMTALADGAGFAMRSAAGRQQAEDAVAAVTADDEALAAGDLAEVLRAALRQLGRR